ncbi:hypothetical protein [Pseudarcicella hirudinis]|nr:hypothetical protein [Pseudarcicella hirudinis]
MKKKHTLISKQTITKLNNTQVGLTSSSSPQIIESIPILIPTVISI